MGLDMLLEILRPLEGLTTKLASMRLQWYVDTDVRGDVITLYDSDTTITPCASQVKVVGALATNVSFADMVLGGTVSSSPYHGYIRRRHT